MVQLPYGPKYMAQSPKGRLIQGLYKPIRGSCGIYFYPGVYRFGLFQYGLNPPPSSEIWWECLLKINRTGFPSAEFRNFQQSFPAPTRIPDECAGEPRFGASNGFQERRKTTFSFKTSLFFPRLEVSETMIEL